MLPLPQNRTMLCLPSWLSVLPMVCAALRSCLCDCGAPSHDGTEGQTCEGGEADFDEGSTAAGVEQRSAAARRHLAQETAAPGDQCHPISFPLSLFDNSLSSLSAGQVPASSPTAVFPFPLRSLCLTSRYSSATTSPLSLSYSYLLLLYLSPSVFLIPLSLAVSISLLPSASHSLSSVAAQSVSECTKHPLRLV